MSPRKMDGGEASPLAPASSPEAAGSYATPLSGAVPRNALVGNWRKVSIDQIKASTKNAITIGPFGSRMKSDCYVSSGVPVIRGNNLTSGRGFGADFVYITQEKAKELRNCMVFEGDLVFPHRGAIGEVGIVPPSDKPFILSSSLMKLTCDPNQAYPLFLFYFFKSEIGRFELLKNASQVGTPGIGQPLSSLKSIELNLPSPEVQKSIAHILGTLDDKIELNRRINQTLEEMAQALFKSWFVDFDPVRAKAAVYAAADETAHSDPTDPAITVSTVGIGHARSLQRQKRQWQGSDCEQQAEWAAMRVISGKTDDELVKFRQDHPDTYADLVRTASLFPSRLVESELGQIPEGWEAKQIEDIAEKVAMGPFGSNIKVSTFVESGVPVISGQHLKETLLIDGDNDFVTEEHAAKLKNSAVRAGDLVFTHAGNIGQVSLVPGSSAFPEYIISQRQFYLRPNVAQTSSLYLVYFFRSKIGQHLLLANAVQVGVPSIARPSSYLKTIRLVCPHAEVLRVFDGVVGNLLAKIGTLRKEIVECQNVRDSLLPKLLSGELEIPDELLADAVA